MKAQRSSLPIEDKESWRWIKAYQALAAVQKRNPPMGSGLNTARLSTHSLYTGASRDARGARWLEPKQCWAPGLG